MQTKTLETTKLQQQNPSTRDLGGVEPDQVEGVEIERRVRAVEDGPGPELSGGEPRDDDPGEPLPLLRPYLLLLRRRARGGGDDHRQQQDRDEEADPSRRRRRSRSHPLAFQS